MSRSSEWTAELLAFSGRPDPTWGVPLEVASRLERSWEQLSEAEDRSDDRHPVLGYRGCVLVAPDGRRWLASGGIVSLRGGASRHDPGRMWERELLASAPAGTVPPFVLEG